MWLAGAVAVASALWALSMTPDPPYRPVGVLAPLLAVAAASGLLWRQLVPLAAMAVTALLVVVNAAAGHIVGPVQFPLWMALFTCYAVGGRRLRAAATVTTVLALAGYVAFDRGTPVAELPVLPMLVLFAVVAGELSRRRAQAVAAEARRADENDRRALVAERLLAQERARLARELHDSLGHTVNVMVLQAGVGRRVFADNPGYAHQALASIETSGRAALEELNRLLRVLQPDERGAPDPFTPTATDLGQLVERVRATGRPVHVRADVGALPDGTARAVYRIVQEALTNAVRHTGTASIAVRLTGGPDAVGIEVVDDGRGIPSGTVRGVGLCAMDERAAEVGGVCTVDPCALGGTRVVALLPLGGP